jgi:AraC-like DNA-binding protein
MTQLKYDLKLVYDNSFSMLSPHYHEDIEIMFVVSSSGEFIAGNQSYPLNDGTILLFNSATLHKTIPNGIHVRYVLHIPVDTLKDLSTQHSDLISFVQECPVRCKVLDESQARELEKKFANITQAWEYGFCGNLQKLAILLDILTTMFLHFSDTESRATQVNTNFVRVAPILRYIDKHIFKPLSLDIIADEFFISKYHLCHLFKSVTGFGVIEYIIRCRVLKARVLLRQGLRGQEVAEIVGFQNYNHFIRTFTKLTGVSPKHYTKSYMTSTGTERFFKE